jgi:hypothetical protein
VRIRCALFVLALSACGKSSSKTGGNPQSAESKKSLDQLSQNVQTLAQNNNWQQIYNLLKGRDVKDNFELYVYYSRALLNMGFEEEAIKVFFKARKLGKANENSRAVPSMRFLSEYFLNDAEAWRE